MLQILDLFTIDQPTLTVDEVMQRLDLVQSTAYRYLKELCDSGLLAPQGKGVYSLGRRIVELERLLQLSDPLLHAGQVTMGGMDVQHPNRSFLLCAFYKDATLCIHKVGPDEIRFEGQSMRIMRGRGTVLSLFAGAGSQALLAHLPPHQLTSLYLTHAGAIAEAGLGESWKDFRSLLTKIRKQGFAETVGRMNPGMHSLAVPVHRPDGKIAGSLLMLGSASAADTEQARALVPALQAKAQEMGRMLDGLDPSSKAPAKAPAATVIKPATRA
jgi:DNA-binding IclR family transcriptional regulator